jgi:hypothetical protein
MYVLYLYVWLTASVYLLHVWSVLYTRCECVSPPLSIIITSVSTVSTSRRGVAVSGGFRGCFIYLFISSVFSLVHLFINSQSQLSLSECSVSGVFADVRAPRWFVLLYYCHVLSHARCLLIYILHVTCSYACSSVFYVCIYVFSLST